jgi:hypothetical protein
MIALHMPHHMGAQAMHPRFALIATGKGKPEQRDGLPAVLRRLVEPTSAEPGCIVRRREGA